MFTFKTKKINITVETDSEKEAMIAFREEIKNFLIIPDEKLKPIFPTEKQVEDKCWEVLREIRNEKLAETDWMVLPDAPTPSKEVLDYRQSLRDLPQTYTKVEDVSTPTLISA